MRTDGSLTIQARNIGFSGFQCTTLGFFLLENCLIQLCAKPLAHITSVVVATAIVSFIYRHIKAYVSKPTTCVGESSQERGNRPWNLSNLISAVLLISIGYMGALAVESQWTTPSALYAICLFVFPWSKVALCRRNLPASWLVMNIGTACGFIAEAPLPNPIFLGISVWLFWMAALGAWIRLIFLKREKFFPPQKQDHHAVEDPPKVMHQ